MVFEGKVELEGEAYLVDAKEARDGDYVRFKASVALWEGGGKVATDIELVVRAVERRGEELRRAKRRDGNAVIPLIVRLL